jgi:hypothetical protein
MVNRTVPARKLFLALLSIILGWAPSALAFQANTATGSTPGSARQRYINPLNLPANSTDGSPRGISLGDPTVVRDGDLYYIFASGVTNGPVPQGGAWVSKDFVNWTWKPLAAGSAKLAIAPHVVKFKDTWYMSGNGAPLYASKSVRDSAREPIPATY